MAGIFNAKSNASVVGTSSADLISNFGSNVTVEGSSDNDTIYLEGDRQVLDYSSYHGDIVYGFDTNDTIHDADRWSNITFSTAGSYASVGSSDIVFGYDDYRGITLKDAVGTGINVLSGGVLNRLYFVSSDANQYITGAEDIDYIINYSSEGSTIDGGSSVVYNFGNGASINGTANADVIFNDAQQVTIDAGAGNDTINNRSNEVSLNGGDGDDLILNQVWSQDMTLVGGKGNDKIKTRGYNVIQYAEGDGNDTVYGLEGGSTIQITEGEIGSAVVDGLNVVIHVGDGAIVLTNRVGKNFYLVDADGNEIGNGDGTVIGEDNVLEISSADETFELDGSKKIIDYMSSYSNTIVGYEEDVTLRIGTWDFTRMDIDGNDVILYAESEGSDDYWLTLKDAADKKITIINPEEKTLFVMPGGATVGNDYTYEIVENHTDGVSVSLGSGVETFKNVANNVTVDAAADNDSLSVEHTYGDNFSLKTGANNDVIFIGDQHTINNVTIDAGDGDNNIDVRVGIYEGDNITYGKNVDIKSGAGDDRIGLLGVDGVSINAGDGNNAIGSDFTTIRNATIKSGKGDDQLTGGAYTNADIDLGDGNNIVELSNNEYHQVITKNVKLKTGSGDDSFNIAAQRNLTVDAGEGDNLIEIGVQDSDVLNLSVKSGSGNDTLSGTCINLNADLGNGDNAIEFNGTFNATVKTGTGNDVFNLGEGTTDISINAGDGDNVIDAGESARNITIRSGAGNDSINAGCDSSVEITKSSYEVLGVEVPGVTIIDKTNYSTVTDAIVSSTAYSELGLSDLNEMNESNLRNQIANFVNGFRGYLKNRMDADNNWDLPTASTISADNLTSDYGASSAANSDVKVAMANTIDHLNKLFAKGEIISITRPDNSNSVETVDKVVVSDTDVAELLSNEISVEGYDTVNSDTSLRDAQSFMATLITNLNATIRNLDLDLQFATDGSDLVDKLQTLKTYSDTVLTIVDDDGSSHDYNADEYILGSEGEGKLVDIVKTYNLIKLKAYAMTNLEPVTDTVVVKFTVDSGSGANVETTAISEVDLGDILDNEISTSTNAVINSDTAVDDAKALMATLISNLNTTIQSVNLDLQFATDGSDLVDKLQTLKTYSDIVSTIETELTDIINVYNLINAKSYIESGKYRDPDLLSADLYNPFFATIDDSDDTTATIARVSYSYRTEHNGYVANSYVGYCNITADKYVELLSALDDTESKKAFSRYYTQARDLYNHLQFTAYNSIPDYYTPDQHSRLLALNSEEFKNLLELIPGNVDVEYGAGVESAFLDSYTKAATLSDYYHAYLFRAEAELAGGSSSPDEDVYGINTNIDAGAGDDTIAGGAYSSINGGAGNDIITGTLYNSTVVGGKGDDTVMGTDKGGWQYQYANGDGNDVIETYIIDSIYEYFNAPGTINITSGTVDKVEFDGNDVVITVGSGTITLRNRAGLNEPVAIRNADGTLEFWYKNDEDAWTKLEQDNVNLYNKFINIGKFINIADNATLNNITEQNVLNYGANVSITLGEDNSNLFNYGDGATIDGLDFGGGTINLNGARQTIKYPSSGSGTITIYGLSDDDTITSDEYDLIGLAAGAENWLSVDESTNDLTMKLNGKTFVLKGAAGRPFNFAYKGSGSSVLVATEDYAAGNPDVDYLINFGTYTITANGSKVFNRSSYAVVKGLDDNDSINNLSTASSAQISTGAGDDTIVNSAENVEIDGGEGDDLISLEGSNQKIEYKDGDGNDTISGYEEDDTIYLNHATIDSGDVDGLDVVLRIGEGSIRLKNAANKELTFIDENNNSTKLTYSNVIEGTEDDDTLNIDSDSRIVKPLGGDDVISLSGAKEIVEYTSGNDTIYGYDEDDTVRINSWKSDYKKDGNNFILYDNNDTLTFAGVGDKKITLVDTDDETLFAMPGGTTVKSDSDIRYLENHIDGNTIQTDKTVEQIKNYAIDVLIKGSAGDDKINGNGSNVTIDAGAGDDRIEYEDAHGIVINGGAGNDYVYAPEQNASLNGGDGDDVINIGEAWNSFRTVVGGKGNDLVQGSERLLYQYANGDGDDTLEGGFVELTSGSVSDVAVETQVDEDGITKPTGNLIFKIGDGSITFKDALADFENESTFAFKNPDGKVSAWYIHWEDTISALPNIVALDGTSTLASYDRWQFFNAVADTLLGSTDNGADLDDLFNYGDNVTIQGEPSSDLVNLTNYGSHASIDATVTGTLENHYNTDVFINTNAPKIYNSGSKVTINGGDEIHNTGAEVEINLDDDGNNRVTSFGKNVTINSGAGTDEVTLFGSKQIFNYVEGDGNDYIHGIKEGDTIRISGIYSTVAAANGTDMIISVGDGSITVEDAADMKVHIADADSIPIADTQTAGIEYDDKKPSRLIVKDPFSGIVEAETFSDKITLIDATGSTQSVILKAGSKATVIEAGKGLSTLEGNSKDDKLYGGTGVNTFVYNVDESKDVVYDYEAQDIISIVGAARDQLSFVDSKNVVTISFEGDNKSKLTINKVNSTDAITFDIDGETFKYGVLPTGVTFNDDSKKTGLNVGSAAEDGVVVNAVEIVSTAKTIDASKAKGAVNLIGNANKNEITAGGNGSTLYGGKYDVADKLIGGAGKDVFVYSAGDGADVISNFDGTDGDVVMLVGEQKLSTGKVVWNNDKMVVTIGSRKLTLEDPQGKVTFINDSDTELYSVGMNMPEGVGYNKNKTAITVGSAASNLAPIDLSDRAYISTVKEVNATAYGGALNVVGNDLANVLRAGKGGSTLDGGAGNDKLYGGAGADVFVYNVEGNDVIYDFDGTKDVVMLKGETSLDKDNVKWSTNKLVVTIDGQKLTLEDPQGKVTFVNDSDTTLYSVGANDVEGMGYNKTKTAITVGSSAAGIDEIDLSGTEYLSTVKEVNATAYGGALNIIGNELPDVLRAGQGGGTLYGGKGDKSKPSADKLYGGAGADTYVYAKGDGADQIFNFDGTKDVVMLKNENSLEDKNINFTANKVVVTISGQKLTLNDPQGKVTFVDEDGKELNSVGINFPTDMGYDSKKTMITVGSGASNVDEIDLTTSQFISTVKEVNATAYSGDLNVWGNEQANILRAGQGNATLDGGYDATKRRSTADKLYGTTVKGSSDVFVWDLVYGGADQIFNYDAAAGDIISIVGEGAVYKSDFSESGSKVVLKAGTARLTINDVEDKPIIAVHDNNTITYGSLPGGVVYADNKKRLTIANPFSGTVDVSDYNASVVTIDGSAATGEITLIGNKKTKAMLGGEGTTTMIGSEISDVFRAGKGTDVIAYSEGDGKDVVYNFDSSTDVLKLLDTTVEVSDFVEKGNDVVLNVGSGSITIKDAPRGTIKVEHEEGTFEYKTLPLNTTYKSSKQVLTLTKDFSGALSASDLIVPIKEINGSAATKEIELTAGSTSTKLTAGKGGSILTGGSGKDTLVGGNGADLFVAGVNNDLIDKYAAGKDRIQIVGTLNSSRIDGSNVILTTSSGKITIKGVVGKELTLVVDGAEQKYKFTKQNTALDDALLSSTSSQLASNSNDYWFMPSTDDAIDELGSLMSTGTSADEAALASLSQSFNPSSLLSNALTSTLEKTKHLKK